MEVQSARTGHRASAVVCTDSVETPRLIAEMDVKTGLALTMVAVMDQVPAQPPSPMAEGLI